MTDEDGEDSLLAFRGFLSFLTLHELDGERLCGEDLAYKLGNRRGDVLTPGTIYPLLKRLHNKGLVQYRSEGRKKYYTLTTKGQQELEKAYRKFSNYFYGLKNKIRRDWYEPLNDDASFYD